MNSERVSFDESARRFHSIEQDLKYAVEAVDALRERVIVLERTQSQVNRVFSAVWGMFTFAFVVPACLAYERGIYFLTIGFGLAALTTAFHSRRYIAYAKEAQSYATNKLSGASSNSPTTGFADYRDP